MYRLDSAQSALLDRVRDAAAVAGAHAAATDADAAFPRAGIDALGAAGALGLNVPAAYGGWGEGMRLACAALDAIAQQCASTAMVTLMHYCGVACYAGAGDTLAGPLRDAARGAHLSTLAWSERGSRSHFWAPVGEAVAEPDGALRLHAEKSWVTSAGIADGYVVSSRSPGSTGPTDTVLAYVPGDAPGMTVAGPWNSMGMRGNASAPMTLDGVRAQVLLCDPGAGFPKMMEILPWFALGNAAISIGIAEAAVASTTAHLTGQGFAHLGSTLADLPNLRERLARMRIATDRARAHLVSVIDSVEAGDPAAQLHVLAAKPSASSAALEVVDLAMQACGGAAFSRHLSVERNFRDARAAGVMAPTSDVLHDFVGKALCGLPLF